ncbi:MAG: hypothetical protein JWO58_2411 [Chitinophagaceae bacterium]|nr:hypothetical protein [Chitinophagaceae bacterium]
MYTKLVIFAVFISLVFTLPGFSQREGDILYKKELTGGINFHTNGGLIGGAMIRYSKKLSRGEFKASSAATPGVGGATVLNIPSDKLFWQVGLEVSFIKNPRELRYLNPTTNNTYIAFKKNAMFVIRPQIGLEWVLFRKAEEEGVQVDFILAGGPSLGFLKPYYIEYQYGTTSKFEAYDPNVHTDFNRILGSAGVLMGIDECKVVPGFHIKPALTFEMGKFNGNVTGLEIGTLLEGFTEKMIILQAPDGVGPIKNKQFFSSVYLTIYYGFRR